MPQPFDCPDLTLPDLLDRASAERPLATALWFEGQALAYSALQVASRSLCASLSDELRPVVLVLENTPEFVAAYFGALRSGRPVCALSPSLPEAALAEFLEELDPADVLTQNTRLVEAACRRAGVKARVAVAVWDEHSVEDASIGAVITPDDAAMDPDDVAVLQFTSGTTGGRKAAMMTHRNLVANALQNNQWFEWTRQDVILGALPLFHTWGMGCVLNAGIAAGAPIALLQRADAATMIQTIGRRGVTITYGSATAFHRLLDAIDADDTSCLESLRYVKAGAMLVGGRLPERWSRCVPDVPMILGYGLTEASPEVSNNPPGAPRTGTVGVALPGTEIRICTPDEPDASMPTGAEGEIQVRGPQVMRGYWQRPEATSTTLLADGWLRTGDLGRLDIDGYLTVVDRLKDLIKYRGWSVVPATVERAFLRHADVAECIVVGVPDEDDGERPIACVVLRDGATENVEELLATAREQLTKYELPRDVRFVDEIPKNAVGKPLRRVLRDQLR